LHRLSGITHAGVVTLTSPAASLAAQTPDFDTTDPDASDPNASDPNARGSKATEPTAWWRRAVIYQIYPRSWADSDGDGIGDLPGVTARLEYLRHLGVDAVWLSPFYTSPQADAGYDVADYRDVDPLFGSLADADALLARAHELGLKVIVDLVPNHSSDEHPWFTAALRARAGSRERERYIFRDGAGADGELPPNNWKSIFGGSAWTRVTEPDGTPGQWYLHLFDVRQPDFNWENPEVREEFVSILRFWLDRGVDGFRVDVAHGLVKEAGLPDWGEEQQLLGHPDEGDQAEELSAGSDGDTQKTRAPMWDQDGVHEIYEQWRSVLDSYGKPDRILCAEAWVEPVERAARYVRPTEMNQAFNFDFLQCPWKASQLVRVIDHSLAAAGLVGAPTTWVLSNHDVVRHASRLGLSQDVRRPNGIGKDDVQPDRELGLRRARAATTLMLGLPGAAYVYQGEELGLPDSTDMPDELRQDPTFVRSRGAELGRDGCRVPMPWTSEGPSLGFGPSDVTWLPHPAIYADYAVDQQVGREGSTFELYRSLLTARRENHLGEGSLRWLEEYAGQPDVVAFANDHPDRRSVVVLANLGATPARLPAGAVVLVSSGALDADGAVPTDVTVWARL
jgi:alpha-glucosidase